MPPLLKRILVHGLLAAGALAAGGLLIAELGSMYLAAGATVRMGEVEPGTPAAAPADVSEVTNVLRTRVPLTMAAWGFGFVAIGELIRHLIRRKPAPPPNPREDTAEVLLNELLRQADEQKAKAAAAPKDAPSPTSPDAHNTPERPA